MTEQRNDLTIHDVPTEESVAYQSGAYQPAEHGGTSSLKGKAKAPVEEAQRQASQIAGDAGDRVGKVTSRAKETVGSELERRQQQLAGQLRGAGDQLESMARQRDAADGQAIDGMVAEVVRNAGQLARETSEWLETHEPGDVLVSVRGFARRRPGTFLVAAAAAGVVVGRLTRGVTANRSTDDASGIGRSDDSSTRKGSEQRSALAYQPGATTEVIPEPVR